MYITFGILKITFSEFSIFSDTVPLFTGLQPVGVAFTMFTLSPQVGRGKDLHIVCLFAQIKSFFNVLHAFTRKIVPASRGFFVALRSGRANRYMQTSVLKIVRLVDRPLYERASTSKHIQVSMHLLVTISCLSRKEIGRFCAEVCLFASPGHIIETSACRLRKLA